MRNSHKILLVVLGSVALIILLFFVNPSNTRVYPPCPFRFITGLYCPGCGSLRAIHELLHGHLKNAFFFNPLMVLSIPFVLCLYISSKAAQKKGKSPSNPLIPLIALIVIISYWILRNIPIPSLDFLRPL